MQIYTLKGTPLSGERVITLGAFDGIHLGHRALIAKTFELAEALKSTPALVTFDPHPRKVIQPHLDFKLLTPLEEKLELLEKEGIPEVIIIPFTKALAELSPDLFIERYLIDYLKIKGIVIGFNFRFGRNRAGDPDLLKKLGALYDFKVEVVPPVTIEGKRVSSTTIRELLKRGEVEEANKFLGRPYVLCGPIVRGKGRGRDLGFPTANLQIPSEKLIPAPGVYAVWAILGQQRYPGAMNIGIKPTFGEKDFSVEVHLLNLSNDSSLYNEILKVELVKFIRGEKKFPSKEALISQIQRDCQQIKEYLC